MQNQKKADPKKGHYRTSPLKNGLTKLPCFLKILASWGDFFDNGLLLYPVQDHTMQCCTRKPFWVAKLEPQSCSASAFPYFEADAELGVDDLWYVCLDFCFDHLYFPIQITEKFSIVLCTKDALHQRITKLKMHSTRHASHKRYDIPKMHQSRGELAPSQGSLSSHLNWPKSHYRPENASVHPSPPWNA